MLLTIQAGNRHLVRTNDSQAKERFSGPASYDVEALFCIFPVKPFYLVIIFLLGLIPDDEFRFGGV